jgi:hypothetical protein
MKTCNECKGIWCEEVENGDGAVIIEYNKNTNNMRSMCHGLIDECKQEMHQIFPFINKQVEKITRTWYTGGDQDYN